MNHERVHRLYAEERLSIRIRLSRRKRAWRNRRGRSQVGGANKVRAVDFMSDQLFDGHPIEVGMKTEEWLPRPPPKADSPPADVTEVLDRFVHLRGKPKSLAVDDGPEFAGWLLDRWA